MGLSRAMCWHSLGCCRKNVVASINGVFSSFLFFGSEDPNRRHPSSFTLHPSVLKMKAVFDQTLKKSILFTSQLTMFPIMISCV